MEGRSDYRNKKCSQQRASRVPVATTMKTKTVAVDDLIQLSQDGRNYTESRNRLSEYFAAENGYIGRFLEPQPGLCTPAEWAPNFALIPGHKRNMQMDELMELHRREAKDLMTYHEWCTKRRWSVPQSGQPSV